MNAAPTAPVTVHRIQVNVRMDSDLLDAVDRAATRERMNRTTWITQALLAHLPADIAGTIERQ